MLEQAMELEHHADFTPQLAQRRPRDVGAALERYAVDGDVSGLKSFEAGDRAQNRRLSRAGRAHDRDQLAPPHVEAHTSEDLARASLQAKIGDVDNGAGHVLHRCSSRRASTASGSDI